ncbi:hypothetical protein EJB05_32609, partial [Eragrostis curvula]
MAARRGDIEQLEDLLRLNEEDAMRAAQVVVVEVERPAAAPPSGAASLPHLLDGVTSNEGDSMLHVVAACGDADEFLRCARMIHSGKSGLLVARNKRGDTPLHCAAAAGNAKMISCLVDLAADSGEMTVAEFLRLRNHCGETALHQAVRAASKASVDLLMSEDSELACIPREGQEGASPLYLAISLGELGIARHLIDTSQGNLSCSGPDGRNVLHAAVSRGQALRMLVEWLKDVTVDVEGESGRLISVPLVSHLANQRDKQTGSTPLHLAASLAGWPYEWLITRWYPHVWSRPYPATRPLLDAKICCLYQPDNKGMYPIHIAAMNGNLLLVKILLQRCPDCATLRDAKGRTFLHVAVEEEKYTVVQYACRTPEFSLILNVQDNEGDTALHRAVEVGNLTVFNYLFRNPLARLDVPNKKGHRPLDVSWSKIPPWITYQGNARSVIQISLALLGAPCGESRADLFRNKHVSARDDQKDSKYLTSASQTIGIVSALVATVTFASAFTLPGSYYQSSSDGIPGTPILAGSYTFDAFMLSDALAFVSSCLATFNLVFATPSKDISIRNKFIVISNNLVRSSVRSLVVAFALGLHLVLAPLDHSHAITGAVWVIISASMLYGHSEPWLLLCVANMARARLGGIRKPVWVCVLKAFDALLSHFWPFILIFILPAIWRIKVHHTKAS